jgi:hypothetical protein
VCRHFPYTPAQVLDMPFAELAYLGVELEGDDPPE